MNNAGRIDDVFGFLERVVAGWAVAEDYRALLKIHFQVGREQAILAPAIAAVQLPLAVYEAITGEYAPAIPVAAACTAVYLGADLFDNLADHELPAAWAGYEPGLISLVAATYLSALPYQALARLEAAPATTRAQLSDLISHTLIQMSAGQYEDLTFAQRQDITPESCRLMLERKSGAECAMFAQAGAILASADPNLHQSYATFGLCIGTATQILSDIYDIWHTPVSQDLLNGKRSLPVVYALTTAKDPADLLAALAAARQAPELHAEVRHMLTQAGALRYTSLVVEIYRQRALTQLNQAAPRPEARPALEKMLAEIAVLSK